MGDVTIKDILEEVQEIKPNTLSCGRNYLAGMMVLMIIIPICST